MERWKTAGKHGTSNTRGWGSKLPLIFLLIFWEKWLTQIEKSLTLYPFCLRIQRQVGLAYRDFACLSFFILSLQLGIKLEEHIMDMILLEIRLVFVFHCCILLYLGGKRTSQNETLLMEKKKIWFLMSLRDRAHGNWICQAGIGRINTTPVVRKAHMAVE